MPVLIALFICLLSLPIQIVQAQDSALNIIKQGLIDSLKVKTLLESPKMAHRRQGIIYAVETSDSLAKKDCEEKDIMDIAKELFANKKRKTKKKERPQKNLNLMLLPDFSVNPTNGLLLGVAATGTWRFGSPKNTRLSEANANVAYTSKKQIVSFIRFGVFTNENKYFLEGDWRYYKFSAPTFGLGTNSPDSTFDEHFVWRGQDINESEGSFPMLYDYVIIHQSVNRKIADNIYLGIGYQLDGYWNIIDERLNLDSLPIEITPHWSHAKLNNYDSSRYVMSGLSLNFLYDSRDNPISPYKGYYFKLNYRYNATFLGSESNTSEIWAEFRTYVGLSKKTPRHLIAFWLFGNFQTSGTLPYFTTMALGNDQNSRSGRGYIAGRYRGESLVYAEVEYRFPIIPCAHTLGGVIFVNATTSTNNVRGVGLFDYVRPAAGVGLRLLFNKSNRLNINIDYAIGVKSQGFYFAGGEAF